MLQAAARQLWRPPTAGILRWWQGFGAWRPHFGTLLDTKHIKKTQTADSGAKVTVIAIAGISEHHSPGYLAPSQGAKLIQGNIGFGLKCNLCRNSCLLAPMAVLNPILRHIEPVGHRQTGVSGGHGNRDGNLAVILFSLIHISEPTRRTPISYA